MSLPSGPLPPGPARLQGEPLLNRSTEHDHEIRAPARAGGTECPSCGGLIGVRDHDIPVDRAHSTPVGDRHLFEDLDPDDERENAGPEDP